MAQVTVPSGASHLLAAMACVSVEDMTRSSTDSHALLNELVALLRLTRVEAQIARTRVSQARRDEIRRELEANASEADARAARIQDALRRLGGAPDVLADTVGRVAALTKVTAEQVQPFSEGLLGDLALEHQLRDRVIFTRVLAEALDESDVVDLMHDLEEAHTETIDVDPRPPRRARAGRSRRPGPDARPGRRRRRCPLRDAAVAAERCPVQPGR